MWERCSQAGPSVGGGLIAGKLVTNVSTGVVGTEGTHHPSVTPLKGQERPGGTLATCSFCFAPAGHNVKETHWSALLQCVLLTQVLGPQASVSRRARDKTFMYHSCIACMDVTTLVFACLLILYVWTTHTTLLYVWWYCSYGQYPRMFV